MSKDFEIAPKFRCSDWKNLNLDSTEEVSADWVKGIGALEARLNDRFIFPADELVKLGNDQKGTKQRFGFAILALDFIVLETLAAFRKGVGDHNGQSKSLCSDFLSEWSIFKNSFTPNEPIKKEAIEFYKSCRCGIHHSGSTNSGLTVGISGDTFQIVEGRVAIINRTKFHDGIKSEFKSYLSELHMPVNAELRCKFKAKMNFIVGF